MGQLGLSEFAEEFPKSGVNKGGHSSKKVIEYYSKWGFKIWFISKYFNVLCFSNTFSVAKLLCRRLLIQTCIKKFFVNSKFASSRWSRNQNVPLASKILGSTNDVNKKMLKEILLIFTYVSITSY